MADGLGGKSLFTFEMLVRVLTRKVIEVTFIPKELRCAFQASRVHLYTWRVRIEEETLCLSPMTQFLWEHDSYPRQKPCRIAIPYSDKERRRTSYLHCTAGSKSGDAV